MSYNPNAYEPNESQPAKKSGGSTLMWVLLLLGGGALLLGLLCCGSFGGLMYIGLNQFSTKVEAALEADPTGSQEFGDVQSVSVDFTRTGEQKEAQNTDLSFRVEGSEGSGYADITTDGGDGITSLSVEMDNGQKFDVDM